MKRKKTPARPKRRAGPQEPVVRWSGVKTDCRQYRSDVPCVPNKLRGKLCPTCDEYERVRTRILIIKLGAVGDVIRTTPLIQKFRETYPHCHLTWITHTPEVLPRARIDRILRFDFRSVYALTHLPFDVVVNLDKDVEACALMADLKAPKKSGFTLRRGVVTAVTARAEHKLVTGLFDVISRTNKKNYLEEIFEICGFRFNREPYVLDVDHRSDALWEPIRQMAGGRNIIGLNTGCGERWLTRLWPEEYWVELIHRLQQAKYFPLLLGGPSEDAQNKIYAAKTGAHYPGTFTLQEFIALSAQCDVILTAVSMMMHIAIGLQVPLVLFNNIFNPHEFELYDNGILLQPSTGCDCYFGSRCTRDRHCMRDIAVEDVARAIVTLASKKS